MDFRWVSQHGGKTEVLVLLLRSWIHFGTQRQGSARAVRSPSHGDGRGGGEQPLLQGWVPLPPGDGAEGKSYRSG